jgi:hypothetical protein
MGTLPLSPRLGFWEFIAEAWRSWREKRAHIREIAGLDHAEFERIAQDLHLTSEEFRHLAQRDRHSADLLLRRMAVLHLESQAIRKQFPDVMRDLQKCCSLCEQTSVCRRDLDNEELGSNWRAYCPNSGTLLSLKAGSLPAETSGGKAAPQKAS